MVAKESAEITLRKSMKPGGLYEVRHKWALPSGNSHNWHDTEYVMYIGPEHKPPSIVGHDPDATNHVVLADGKAVVVDYSFLRFLEPAGS